jgi:hypothetical protein
LITYLDVGLGSVSCFPLLSPALAFSCGASFPRCSLSDFDFDFGFDFDFDFDFDFEFDLGLDLEWELDLE